MPKKNNWFWIIYFFLFLNFTIGQARDFFTPDSNIGFYYALLNAFNVSFFFSYGLNLAQIILNLFNAAPLILYAFEIPWASPQFWQCLLAARLIFDLTGHNYEWLGMIALFKTDPILALMVSIQFLMFYVPSYIPCYRFAFSDK